MELTIDQALQQGIAAHREGKLQDAERLYRAILQAQPSHPDANHNLGVLTVAVGRPLEALTFFKQALDAAELSASALITPLSGRAFWATRPAFPFVVRGVPLSSWRRLAGLLCRLHCHRSDLVRGLTGTHSLQ